MKNPVSRGRGGGYYGSLKFAPRSDPLKPDCCLPVQGGAKSVVWTSTIQMVLIIAGLLAVLIGGAMDLGGIDEIFEIAKKYERIQFDE